MSLYYKFVSAKDYDSISMVGPFISVSDLKREIFESKYKAAKKDSSNSKNGFCFGTDFDLLVIDAQTNEEYVNESTLIPKNSKVLIRRVPGGRGGRNPIDVTPIVVGGKELPENNKYEDSTSSASTLTAFSSETKRSGGSVCVFDFDTDFDAEFGGDVFAVPAAKQTRDRAVVPCESSEEDEKSRIEALVNTPALDWRQDQSLNGVSFGRTDKRGPPAGYVCHRCSVAGHFIQHCPTNGDPNYDFKRTRPPTGIPKSKLAAVVLVPDEAAFEKAMEGIPSAGTSKPVSEIPQELLCSLCKHVMKDAVISSKCCFRSFCHKCIRDHLLELKSACVCGATNILADYLIPNVTLRDTINRFLKSGFANSSSSENSTVTVNSLHDAASACHSNTKVSSTAIPAVPAKDERKRLRDEAEDGLQLQMVKKASTENAVDVSEAAAESSKKGKQVSPLAAENTLQNEASDETGRKRKKRKMRNVESDELYMMPNGSYGYDPNWVGMNMGMEGYMPYNYGGNYGLGHYSTQYGRVMPQNHYFAYQMGRR